MKEIKNHYGHWLPPKLGVEAVTLGHHIFYVGFNPRAALRRHEEKHVEQYEEHGFIGFLIKYFIEYLRGRLKGLGHWEAYREISFEIEARRSEHG